jgi:hypothetical protein
VHGIALNAALQTHVAQIEEHNKALQAKASAILIHPPDQPLLINCPMVVALYRWLDEAVQPAAREAFGRKRIPEDVQSLA